MRKTLLCLVMLAMSCTLTAGNWVGISSPVSAPAKIRVVSSDIDRSVVHFSLSGFNLRDVQTLSGNGVIVEAGNATPVQEAGAPDLPKLTLSLVIPDRAEMGVRIVFSSFKDFPGITVAPSKGVIMRNTDPADVPYTYGPAYSADAFYPGKLGETRDPYIVRDVRGQTLIAYPFQYNPVTKVLRVYYDLTLELYKTGETGLNPLETTAGRKQLPQGFIPVLQRQFANLSALTYTPLEEYGNLLVICHQPFMEAMQPYVDWKRAEGYRTEMIPKDSAGSTAFAIKSYISGYYSTNGLTHVLLVGDAAQVPTNTGGGLGGPSDNAYGYLMGNDHYADVFVGRFSAETAEQVSTQVQRTLDYEQNPGNMTGDWFTTVIGIASDQGPGDDNEMDYEHIRNQQTKLLAYTYTANPELFDGSQGGNDAPGNPSPAQVSTEVNNGSGLILYTGHGSKTAWGTSGFSNNNVNQLTNTGMLPFIWSVACQNGNFVSGSPCFAEAWLRASQGGQPTGAVAFLGSTIDQSWNSPMEGQDAMTDILIESDSGNIKRTFAGLSLNGCMKMIDSYGTDGAHMADTWTVFGDPTIMVRTAVPQPMAVACDSLLFVGDSILAVYCGTPSARVTATVGDSILATCLVVNDTASLAFPPLTVAGDTIRLVATAYNMLPYQGQLVVRSIPEPVVAGFSGVPERVIPGHTVSFADTSSGSTTTWQWSFPGGTPSVSNEKNPVITYDTKGTYDVELIAGNGFYSDTLLQAGYITVDFPINTVEKEGKPRCTVSPNPGNGQFVLDLNTSSPGSLEIFVYNLAGTAVFHESGITSGNHLSMAIDLTAMPEGLYFLQIKGGKEILSRKIIIRK